MSAKRTMEELQQLLTAHHERILELQIEAGKAPVWRAIVRRLMVADQANKIVAGAALRELRGKLDVVDAAVTPEQRAAVLGLINEVQGELNRIELEPGL